MYHITQNLEIIPRCPNPGLLVQEAGKHCQGPDVYSWREIVSRRLCIQWSAALPRPLYIELACNCHWDAVYTVVCSRG